MNLIDFYYDFNVGESTENIKFLDKTNKLFNYLLEAGISENEIIDLIIREFDNKDYLTHEDLPDKLWDNSLLKRDTFYYHKDLEILSAASNMGRIFSIL